jgi:hypothetical protein
MSEDPRQDGLLKEYEQLRQGILQTEGAILQVLGIVLGAIGVIVAQGMSSGNPYTFLIALPLLIFTNSYIADKRWGIWLVAFYLRNYIEDKNLGLQWETWLYKFRTDYPKKSKKRTFLPGQNIMDREFVLFNSIGLLHVLLFFVYAKNLPAWRYSLPIILFLILLVVTWNSRRKLIAEGREGEGLRDYLEEQLIGETKQISEKNIEADSNIHAAPNNSFNPTPR